MKVPNHVAIIMDGNGRWAQHRHHPRVYGHIKGASRVKKIVHEAGALGIGALTLFAFSTENWARPESEKSVLWKLFKRYLENEVEELAQENVRLRILGEVERLPEDVKQTVHRAIEKLKNNTGLQLNLAVSYGSRREIVWAATRFAEDCKNGLKDPSELNEKLFEQYLWTAELGELSDVDLVIRTSGELRVSNFLLWQAAYAEYVFTEVAWPDFTVETFRKILHEFSLRDRRFGKISSASQEANITWKSN